MKSTNSLEASQEKPLWLPVGSIRALIALGITTAFLFDGVDTEVVLLVLGFYFGSRTARG